MGEWNLKKFNNACTIKLAIFWRSFVMSLVNCKAELKLKWRKYCVLSVISNDNDDANSDIISAIKCKIVCPCSHFISKRQSKLLSKKNLKDQCIGMNVKQSENENMTNEYRFFLESNFAVVKRLFVLVNSNEDNNAKRYKAKTYYQEF